MKRTDPMVMTVVVAFSISFLVCPGIAQVVYEIDPIVVTAERMSQKAREALSSVTVITRREIEAMQAEDLGEVLRTVSGLQIQQYGSYGNLTQVRMRGSESGHLLVMINGVEVNDPFYGGFDIAHLNADQIERVEVVRGTQTALYGADAIGGVVNVILREGEEREGVGFWGEIGGLGFRKVGVGVGGKKQLVEYAIRLSHLQTAGSVTRDAYRSTLASALARIRSGGEGRVVFGLLYYEYFKELPFSYFYDFGDGLYHQYIDPNNSQEGEMMSSYIKAVHSLAERFETSVRLGLAYNRIRNQDRPDIVWNFANTSLHTRKLDLVVDERLRLSTGNHLLLTWQWQDEVASRLDNSLYASFSSVDKRVNNSAISASLHLRVGESLKCMAGVRSDNHSIFSSEISPQVRVALKLPEVQTRLRLGWSRGFRVPTLSDLYFPGYGNPSLKPELARDFEMGIDQEIVPLDDTFLSEARLSLTFFLRDVSDLIAINSKTWVSENIAEAHYRGLEVEYSSLLGTRGLFRGSYAHVRAREVKEGREFALDRRPRDTFNLFIAYRPTGAVELSAEYESIGKQRDELIFVTHDGVKVEDEIAPYDVLNLVFSYVVPDKSPLVGGSKLFIKLRNALDRSYEEVKGYRAPGRLLTAGFSVRL